MLSQVSILANQLFEEYAAAESAKDRELLKPLALAAVKQAEELADADFRKRTLQMLDLSSKLSLAIEQIGSDTARARLSLLAPRLGEVTRLVHDQEGMRTTWSSKEELERSVDDEKVVPPSGIMMPVPPAPAPKQQPAFSPPAVSNSYADLADEYVALFRSAEYTDQSAERSARKIAAIAVGNQRRYQTVGDPIQVPWWFIAGIHLLESSFNFTTHLHNGDPLSDRTFRVPAKHPKTGAPPFTWAQSAEDALRLKKYHGLLDWSLARALYRWEAWNGFGYRPHRVATPYLWAMTTNYVKGKFVGDGVFLPNQPSKQCGAATFLKALSDLGAVQLQMELSEEGEADVIESGAADAEESVKKQKPNIDGSVSPNIDFKAFFEANLPDVKHFQWHEFLIKGGTNSKSNLNTDPPRHLWPNVLRLARVLDRLREEMGRSVILTSVYRSPEYNATLPGAKMNSQHQLFRAADFKIVGPGNPASWAAVLYRYRNEKMFEGGIGVYDSFVHLDTRGYNADW
ncbi:D-Ala-D-Ala carboxypeptidase family metallohydrolase [Ensifer sp. YR511]|uniref:D-Ala-D-Ala carboxypeptidase family metallohydrolase n=1 Tax=Ensifer sp. YR511 TaxID=1855294 RepID=UPI00089224CD|nr:D-Ala-D-Ala carboxypeptidase family metallohydrolase [Ensifer sp. YR511]SDN71299.1 Lysozyme family protein [Ensifer sp. YR511]